MKTLVFLIVPCILFLFSCQKEISVETNSAGGGGGSTAGNKLVRVVTRVGADSFNSVYTYTGANLINSFSQSGNFSGVPVTVEIRAVRNSANVITSTVFKSNVLSQFGLDSVTVNHIYDAASARYKYSISRITIFGFTDTDSAVYNYDASGKLSSGISYIDDGTGYRPSSKEEYTYSGANLANTKSYEWDDASNNFDLLENVTYEYDAKINPLSFPKDAPVLGMNIFYSANNPTKITTVETITPSTIIQTATYTYNANNRPVTATTSASGITNTNTYYYQ